MEDLTHLMAARKKIEDEFGPLEFVLLGDENKVRSMDPRLVWTVRSPENTSVLVNGFFNTDDAEGFYIAQKPCIEASGSVTAVDVLAIDCEDCLESEDPSACSSCQGSELQMLDFQEIISRGEIDLGSASEIWSQRVPGETFGEVCVPADYMNTPHSRSLPRPPWVQQ